MSIAVTPTTTLCSASIARFSASSLSADRAVRWSGQPSAAKAWAKALADALRGAGNQDCLALELEIHGRVVLVIVL